MTVRMTVKMAGQTRGLQKTRAKAVCHALLQVFRRASKASWHWLSLNVLQPYREELRVGAVTAAIAFFFTQGLPLWDADYGQWLTQAQASYLEIFKRILLPITTEPEAWGYSDRPVLVLLYKFLFALFGTWGSGFYFVKSVVFGVLSGFLYHWMRRLELSRAAALGSLTLFVLSANVVAALVWHSDFALYAQLLIAMILAYSVRQIEKGPTDRSVYANGIREVPFAHLRFMTVFFLSVYLGAKLRADVSLVPLILLAFLWVYRRPQFQVYFWPFSLTFAATLPWSVPFFKKLPPFIPGATAFQGQAWTYSPFHPLQVLNYLCGDVFSLRIAPISVAGGIGLFTTLVVVTYGAYRYRQRNIPRPAESEGLLLIWFGMALLACGVIARPSALFQIRYTVLPMVPAVLLCGVIFHSMLRHSAMLRSSTTLRVWGWVQPAFLMLIAVQSGIHVFQSVRHRRHMGHTLVAVDRVYREIENKHSKDRLVHLPGFLPYAHQKSFQAEPSPVFREREVLEDLEQISAFQPGQTFALSWSPLLDPRFVTETMVSGCGATVFDWFFPCSPADGAVLMRYVGEVPTLRKAESLVRRGKVKTAREMVARYVQKEPRNFGAVFTLGAYSRRLKDYEGMERNFEKLGPLFPRNPSVLYQWGLAKQELRKYNEAAGILERAYILMPQDYEVGFQLADNYYQRGKRRQAIATLNDLMKTYPDDPTVRSVLETWKDTEKDTEKSKAAKATMGAESGKH